MWYFTRRALNYSKYSHRNTEELFPDSRIWSCACSYVGTAAARENGGWSRNTQTGSHVSKTSSTSKLVHKCCKKHTREDSLDIGNKHKNLGEAGGGKTMPTTNRKAYIQVTLSCPLDNSSQSACKTQRLWKIKYKKLPVPPKDIRRRDCFPLMQHGTSKGWAQFRVGKSRILQSPSTGSGKDNSYIYTFSQHHKKEGEKKANLKTGTPFPPPLLKDS